MTTIAERDYDCRGHRVRSTGRKQYYDRIYVYIRVRTQEKNNQPGRWLRKTVLERSGQ